MTGGTNAGGPGRPPSAIREHCRTSFEERISTLEKIADDTLDGADVSIADRIKALDLLGKYGGVDKVALTPDEQPEGAPASAREVAALLFERLERIRTVEKLERMLIEAATRQGQEVAVVEADGDASG